MLCVVLPCIMSLKALKMKITATESIKKITSSMKMVAASKCRGAETRLLAGRPFAAGVNAVFKQPDLEFDETMNIFNLTKSASTNHLALVTSDRGLCGGVNTIVCKTAKFGVEAIESEGNTADISVYGDKGRAQMARLYGEKLTNTVEECYKTPMNFTQASALANSVLEADAALTHIVYNKFKSIIQYDTSVFEMANLTQQEDIDTTDETGPFAHLAEYDFEPELKGEALENFKEFATAGVLYGCLIEGSCSEETSRMSAMDNASKNAGEMIDTLTIKYNRARQAVITTELIEIISGASALED